MSVGTSCIAQLVPPCCRIFKDVFCQPYYIWQTINHVYAHHAYLCVKWLAAGMTRWWDDDDISVNWHIPWGSMFNECDSWYIPEGQYMWWTLIGMFNTRVVINLKCNTLCSPLQYHNIRLFRKTKTNVYIHVYAISVKYSHMTQSSSLFPHPGTI